VSCSSKWDFIIMVLSHVEVQASRKNSCKENEDDALQCIVDDHDQQKVGQQHLQQHLYSKSVDCVADCTHCDAGTVAALKV